ncbi:hypothetical protein DV702_10080 [Sporosarcina sp. PTS2304]|uniref:hypothetical protein n=1 Tax=Sporosarcina sp. PTS2304 TaxID=2283194 RepID=UPI000E0D575E|nr:hypothetical protein [Sporosarcina sp. PTS2304]AXI00037.1 hypothetical protein DV702_10080 [Sporosarcina sp. PTS2304]
MIRSLFEMHWQYYVSIESMLRKTNQYVTHSNKNKAVYSDEFASIILLSCSELDSLLKQLCINYNVQSKGSYFNMKDYAPLIEKYSLNDFGLSTDIRVMNDNGILLFPFKDIDATKPYANLKWWKDYQSIKHDRIKNVTKGNLLNAISSVAAQFTILWSLTEFIDESQGREYIRKNYWSDYWIPVV